EVIAPQSFIDKTIKDIDVRAKYKLHIIGIKRKVPYIKDDGETDFKEEFLIAPSASEILQDGDALILIGTYSDIDKVKKL
ncbi:MAG: TrkA C-terminal domain-containing protein, partial [Elusimicrobiota bacterium]|nr:TrkA C-terminal domain-containing protein [Elusimicrobiota bacterium]